ncbi:UPF0280 family protein [Methanococcoides methylutens]|uniref:UPF0280 protein MCMEM_0827 n=1 Tax=Methanococcoides methylutens MM1 TaxID=1434104 RepID=A0A0E3WZI6_METMT|nr:UPF0280 family protein [Methanococcoides methylutens]AKB84880.1 hypothetical protein MCMEM_0827 [Methanococcoides methylutens MM1]
MKEHFQLKETIVTIVGDEFSHIKAAKDAIALHRAKLESYILRDPYFKITLEPHKCSDDAPEVVKRLVRAGNAMGIGPMSAVAGTISSLAVEAMVEAGASYAIVDNGGDIAIVNDREVIIGIYAGNSPITDIGLVIEPSSRIRGICTSSGTVGPSISFGMADAAVIFSDDVSLADSAATALSNATDIGRGAVEKAFDIVKDVPGIDGALLVQGEYMGMWGDVPKISRADVRYECITKG